MKRLMYLTLSLMTFIGASSTSFAGGDGSGGGNDVEGTFSRAASIIVTALSQHKKRLRISDRSANIIEEYKSRLLMEFNGVNIIYDHVSTEYFIHSNGSRTWLRTDFMPLTPIEIRTQVMDASINRLTLETAISYLAHEVGHHIFGDNDQKAWDVSAAVSEYVDGSVKFPYMLNISTTDFQGLTPGCRDLAHIEADPFTGIINIDAKSTGYCLYDESQKKSVPSYRDQANITFECKRDRDGRTVCEADKLTTHWGDRRFDTYAEIYYDGNVLVHYEYYIDRLYRYSTINQKFIPVDSL